MLSTLFSCTPFTALCFPYPCRRLTLLSHGPPCLVSPSEFVYTATTIFTFMLDTVHTGAHFASDVLGMISVYRFKT